MGTLQRTFDYAGVAVGRPFLLLDHGSTQIFYLGGTQILAYRCRVHPQLFNAPLLVQRSVVVASTAFGEKEKWRQTVDVKYYVATEQS